jgi:hypothetical protein
MSLYLHIPRGKGKQVLPYRNAAVVRRPPPVAPRQVESHNLRRRRPWAQLEQAEDHGVSVQVQQPNDNDPQPAYQPAPAQDHHNENDPPPHILPAPQVVQPVPQIENGEALIIPTKSDIDVFVSQKMCNQI